jgi:invasion protein IalB
MLTEPSKTGTGASSASDAAGMRSAIFAAAALLAAGMATEAAAQSAQPQNVGVFRDWNAFTGSDASGKVCFIASQPTDSQYSQTVSGRDPAFFQITSAPANGVRNEASTIVGFTILTSAEVVVDIDGTKFRMFLDPSHPDTAWSVPEQEAQLVEAMRKGSRMSVTATSSPRQTVVTDTYSLSGVTAALQKLGEECP